MADFRNDDNNNRNAGPQNADAPDVFQKWNGGDWEKVCLGTAATPPPDPIEEEITNSLEDGLPMKVMRMMGLPKSYRHSLYSDIVEEVQEITSLPAETASTFYNIINWVCGRNEVPPAESIAKPAPDEHLKDATTSADSILTGPGSRIETPFHLSLTDFAELQKSEDNLCIRLPSLLSVSPSNCALLARESTAVYSCQILEDGGQPQEQKTANNEHIEGKHVTFAGLENEAVDNANGSQLLPQEETGVAEKEAENDSNQNAVSPPQTEKTVPSSEAVSVPNASEPTPVLLPQLDLQEAPIESEVPSTSTAPLPSSSDIPPLPQLASLKPEEKVEKTTSEIQLELQDNLKTLEVIIKKLYKSLNKEGPLKIVANFIPTKRDGKFSVDFEPNPEASGADGNNAKKTPSTSTLDTDQDGNGTESSEYGPATVTITNVKRLIPEAKSTLDTKGLKKSVTINNYEEVFGIPNTLSNSLYLQQPSSTLLGKRSTSFLGKMAVTGQSQSPSLQIPPQKFQSQIKFDPNNNIERGMSSSNQLNPPTPILKPSKAAMMKPVSLSDIPTSEVVHSSDFSTVSSGSEDTKTKKRPATSTGNAYASSHNLSKFTPPVVPPQRRLYVKNPRSKSRSPHSNQQHPRPAQPPSRIERWDHSSFGNPHRIGNVRVVKTCGRGAGTHEKNTFQQQQEHHFEQGDYVEESDDASTEDSSMETTSMETGSEENTGTDELEMDPIEKALNYDFDYCQRPATQTPSFLGEISKSKATLSTVGLPPRTPPPTIVTSQDQNKFKATVYIPSGSGSSSQRRSNSYREMFEKKNQNQNQTVFVDLTSRKSGTGAYKRDSEYVQLGQRTQSRYGRAQ